MLKILVFILINILLRFCESYSNNKNIINEEINCVNDLPLIKLLKIRKSLENLQCSTSDKCENNEISNNNNDNISEELIESRTLLDDNQILALPLVGRFNQFFNGIKNSDRSFENINENHHHQMWEKTKSTKLETVFQLSITALSFLAFGGYLLCMIVQAIKSKGTTYFHPVATPASQTNVTPLKKIKVYRRQRRTITKNSIRNLYNDQMAMPNPNDMYKILILFAEGYVQLTDIND